MGWWFYFVCLVSLCSLTVAERISSENLNCTFINSQSPGSCLEKCPSKTEKLYIQGFVPATNPEFRSENIVPAAFLAINEINHNCSILPDYELVIEFVNTKCDPSEATWQLINSIVLEDRNRGINKIMFFGGGCSLATEPLAALAGRFYQIPMLSYGASSPALSENNMFPLFFRTLPSEIQANSARIAVMNQYGWKKVATLHETEAIFTTSATDLHTQYNNYLQSMSNDTENELILRSFTDNPDIPLGQIDDMDIRIIIGYYYENKAVTTLCRALQEDRDLHSKNHVWMYIAWYDGEWWKDPDNETNCTVEQLKKAVNNSFFFDSYNLATDKDAPTDTYSKSLREFQDKYQYYLDEFHVNNQTMPLTSDETITAHPYYTYSYDAVFTLAFALDSTEQELKDNQTNITLGDFMFFNESTSIISQRITDYMLATNFTGVSGRVIFDKKGTRISQNAIYQLRENQTTGNLSLQLLAIHQPYLDFDESRELVHNYNLTYDLEPLFNTEDGKPPTDRSTPEAKFINQPLIILFDIIISISIVIALALLVFNLVTYTKPLIRDSAPLINIIIICGCVVMLTASYLLGIDSETPSIPAESMFRAERFTLICNLRLWLFTIGFTLSFGALFAKTSQVYRVYTNQSLKKQDVQLWRFFLILAFFLLVDVGYLSLWSGVPMFRLQYSISNSTNGGDDISQYEQCNSENFNYLIGALYVYKGLVVVFGLFLAYESRNVKYLKINDSRFVSIAMYIVVILIGIGAPLSLVLAIHNFLDPAYGLSVAMIIASTLSCLLIIHIPKFYYMSLGKETMVQENIKEEITESSGLQLGPTVDLSGITTIENDVATLKDKNAQKDIELRELQGVRNGSDNDSGVLVTGDDTEMSSENDYVQPVVATPTDDTPPEASTL